MVLPTKQAEKGLKTFGKMRDRLVEGQKLVALEAATQVLRFLYQTAPDIDGQPYVNDLKPVFRVNGDGSVDVSIVGESRERQSTPEDDTAIAYPFPRGALSPVNTKMYEALEAFKPWPLGLYPIPTGRNEPIGLSVRRVSRFEYDAQVSRIIALKPRIESRLRGAGFTGEIRLDRNSKSVQTDLGFAILQVEYGIGRKPDAHWRPAVNGLKRELNVLQDKLVRYLMNEPDSIFTVDSRIKEVSNIRESDTQLQEKIAQSTGFKLDS